MIEFGSLTNLEVLTLTLIGEARGEPVEGQIAVGCVIRNRSLTWNKSIWDICLSPKQFSCWNEHDPNRILLDELAQQILNTGKLDNVNYLQCQYIAKGILSNELLDNTHGSLNYLTIELFSSPNKPSWARNVNFAISKGHQVFFTASSEVKV